MIKIIIASVFLFSTAVMADEKNNSSVGKSYGGIQYAMATYKEGAYPLYNPKALVFKYGYNVSRNLAVETRLGIGIAGDTNVISGTSITLDIGSFFGAYAVGKTPINDTFEVYGLVGITNANVSASTSTIAVAASTSSLSFGVGMNLATQKNLKWNIEYVSYINKTNGAITAISLGANFAF